MLKFDSSTLGDGGEKGVAGGRGQDFQVAREKDPRFGSGESDKGMRRRKKIGVSVKVDGNRLRVGAPLRTGDGDGVISALLEGFGGVGGAGQNCGFWIDMASLVNEARLRVERFDLEHVGHILGDAITPEAVEVDEG